MIFRNFIATMISKTHKAVDDCKVFLMRTWLSICNFIVRLYLKAKRVIATILILFLLGSLLFILGKYYTDLNNYLCRFGVDPAGMPTGFFSGLFIAIGASVLGVLAITFSLSLFAIQQAADKHTPTVLASFLKDRTNNFIFWTIGFIAFFLFLFAVFPLKEFLYSEVVLTFFFVILILFLLKKQYNHITKLVNPIYQIVFRHNEAIEELSKIDKWLNLMIRIRAIQPGDQGNQENET